MGIKQYVAVILITVIACASITVNLLNDRDIKQLEAQLEVATEEAELTISGLEKTIGEQGVVINDLEGRVDYLEEVIEYLE